MTEAQLRVAEMRAQLDVLKRPWLLPPSRLDEQRRRDTIEVRCLLIERGYVRATLRGRPVTADMYRLAATARFAGLELQVDQHPPGAKRRPDRYETKSRGRLLARI